MLPFVLIMLLLIATILAWINKMTTAVNAFLRQGRTKDTVSELWGEATTRRAKEWRSNIDAGQVATV